MDLLLIMTYTAICIAIFKIFKIPLNKWSIPTAILGGIVIVGAMTLLMNYNHPFTQLGKQAFSTTPIVPGVRGRVIDVPVKANQPLEKGDVLFKLDPTPFQAEVDKIEAQIKEASQDALGLESTVLEAEAERRRAISERDKAKREYERYQKGFNKGAFTEQELDTKRQAYLSAEEAINVTEARLNQANLALNSQIGGQNTTVARLLSEYRKARFNLEQTVARAPTDGFVTQLSLRPGMMAVPFPLSPVMTFIHDEERIFTAAFRQNSLQRLAPGFEAEFIFPSMPGRVFQGEVIEVLPAIAESQFRAQGSLIGTDAFKENGRALVSLKLDDDAIAHQLPLGASFEVAVYSDRVHHVSIMRKILIRMKSWQSYLYIDH
ncbi:hypothetical protein BZG76_08435 [Salinivibrio sp. AR647]|uniref:HlyD family secretion protein n=1 Tax=Salinivibrio sp. AR647 TaxID=1909438 RepID=UPI00098695DB|nr:HlyD family secretion protein [Salinivibrio sp. AR647]OOE92544.1 hypothetical protein BZG76_08435 [Salinivibrio sp. AR647]